MRLSPIRWLLLIGLFAIHQVTPGSLADDHTNAIRWEPVGLNGSGGMYAPTISPVDPRVMMLNGDMSGAYLTRVAEEHWTMIDHSELRASTPCRPAFYPTNAQIIFAAQASQDMKVELGIQRQWYHV